MNAVTCPEPAVCSYWLQIWTIASLEVAHATAGPNVFHLYKSKKCKTKINDPYHGRMVKTEEKFRYIYEYMRIFDVRILMYSNFRCEILFIPNGIAQMRLALFNDTVNDIKGKMRRSAVKPLSFSLIVPQISVINDHHYSYSILHCFYCDFFMRLRKSTLIY